MAFNISFIQFRPLDMSLNMKYRKEIQNFEHFLSIVRISKNISEIIFELKYNNAF